MKNLRRLLPYIVLNILVSALTTMLVLLWWERKHQVELPPVSPRLTEAAAAVPTDDASPGATAVYFTPPPLPPLGSQVIQIQNVYGTGDLQNEVVVLSRIGDEGLWMNGWQIRDEDGNVFNFPELLLNKGGGIQVYTAAGADSVVSLHWGLDKAVWEKDETVLLLDHAGNERASYRIP